MNKKYDYVVLGAGVFGLYAALCLGKKGFKVAVVDSEKKAFLGASYVNQARLHNGYHYPRSVTTARKSHEYYARFKSDFHFALNDKYTSIYGISSAYSLVNKNQFVHFSEYVGIPTKEIPAGLYFDEYMVEAAFETEECSFDAIRVRDYLLEQLAFHHNCTLYFSCVLEKVNVSREAYQLLFNDNSLGISANTVINATYANMNFIHRLFGFELLPLKYELAEVILTNVNAFGRNIGITVMDGPFFSLMPFGQSGYHSLTSVEYTPHTDSNNELPPFNYEKSNVLGQYRNQPKTAWSYMYQLCKKFLNDEIGLNYVRSLFTVKTVLMTAELDDARPTIIREMSSEPRFISVFSGKFNTIYDLETVLP